MRHLAHGDVVRLQLSTGFADQATYRRLTAKYGPTRWAAPVDVLKRAGVHPDEVDTVLLTHNHFDHAGCAGEFPNAHLYIQRREVTEHLAALLARLPETQRAAVVLRHVTDLPLTEVAEVLGCPVGTAKSHVSRGLARLRTLIHDTEGPT